MIYENINLPVWNALKHLEGKRILDVGCGTGSLGQRLQDSGNTVEGITISEEEAEIARNRIEKVHVMDLNTFSPSDSSIQGPFDVLLCASVLEHLVDPKATLTAFMNLLASDGTVCVSLPNIACFYVRLGLLFGRFDMSSTGGILDDTHLHFYTRRSAQKFLASAGLRVERRDYMPGFSVWIYQFFKRPPAGEPIRMEHRKSFRIYEKGIYPMENFLTSLWPGLLANECVFSCRRSEA